MIRLVKKPVRKTAGAGAGDDRAWIERSSWAYGLVSPDPVVRSAALDRQARGRREVEAAFDRMYQGPFLTRMLLFPVRNRARNRAIDRCMPGVLWSGSGYAYARGSISSWPRLPLALLFLEWEARYPREWTEHAKSWGVKQALIRDLAATDHDQQLRTKLVELVDLAVRRAHRCKDREYVRVARAVDGAELRERLHDARRSEDPTARLHASYVLWLLDRPEIPNTRHVWRTWSAGAP